MADAFDTNEKKPKEAAVCFGLPDFTEALSSTPDKERLKKGDIVIEVKESGTEKIVSGRILLDDSAEKIWPILANPYEFANGLYPRMRKIEILKNEKEHSRMSCTIDLGMVLPKIVATVDTDYVPARRIDFHKVGGSLKSLSGGWTLTPQADGKTEVAYWMNIDPGIPVPAWVVREGIKMELPNTLKAVRKRLNELHNNAKPAPGHILASEI